jgi:hypothetical protein
MARSIIEHRSKVGRFQRIEELMNVKGVGQTTCLRCTARGRVRAHGSAPGRPRGGATVIVRRAPPWGAPGSSGLAG